MWGKGHIYIYKREKRRGGKRKKEKKRKKGINVLRCPQFEVKSGEVGVEERERLRVAYI